MKRKERLYRVVAFLKRAELDFLDNLVKDIYFSYGVNIPRGKLIEEVIAEFKDKGIEDKKELVNKLLYSVGAMIERRKYPRLKKSLLVDLRKMDSLEQYKSCLTEDISMGGLKIDVPHLDEPLLVNQIIELAIKGHEEKLEPIKAIGRIAWIREKKNKQGFETGVQLTHIRKEDRERFTKYLSEDANTEDEIEINGGTKK